MVQLIVKVVPKSSRDEIVGWKEEALKVRVSAAPEKGAANRAVIRLLAKELQVSSADVTILSGQTSRTKRISIPDEAFERLPTR